LLPLSDNQLFKALLYIRKYNLNSADAYHLSTVFELKETLVSINHSVTLISSDERLIRASKNEGIHVFDPENDTASHLQRLL